MDAGCHVFMEKPIATTYEDAEAVVAKPGRTTASSCSATSCATTRPGRSSSRSAARSASPGHAHEPQPAVLGSGLELAQEPHGVADALGRLRGALRRHHVPDDPGEAGARARHRGEAQRRDAAAELRRPAGRVRRRLGRLVRGRLGADDERGRLFREGRGRAQGCVSIVVPQEGQTEAKADAISDSADIDQHKTNALKVHYADIDAQNNLTRKDEWINMADEPDHQELCDREQAFFLKAIREDLDLTDWMNDAVNSLRIVLAADESIRTRRAVELRCRRGAPTPRFRPLVIARRPHWSRFNAFCNAVSMRLKPLRQDQMSPATNPRVQSIGLAYG